MIQGTQIWYQMCVLSLKKIEVGTVFLYVGDPCLQIHILKEDNIPCLMISLVCSYRKCSSIKTGLSNSDTPGSTISIKI